MRFYSIALILFALSANAAEPSKLPLGLIGTIVRAEPEKSLASVLLVESKASGEFRSGQRIGSSAELESVERQRIQIKNLASGKLESIYLGAYNSAKAVTAQAMEAAGAEKEFHVKRSKVDSVLANMAKFLQDARAAPVKSADGKISGFRLEWIAEGSLYHQLGLKPGDVLKSVNGVALDSLASGMQIFEQFRNSSMIRIAADRGGKSVSLTYLIRE